MQQYDRCRMLPLIWMHYDGVGTAINFDPHVSPRESGTAG